jgi:hypothetical protein
MRRSLALPILTALTCALAWAATAAAAEGIDPSVQWGGRQFTTPTDLARWLEDRSLSYATWAGNHPRAVARLEGRERPEPEPAAPTPVAAAAPASGSPEANEGSRSLGRSVLLAWLAAAAVILTTLAALPALRLGRLLPNALEVRQAELAGAGVATALALAIAFAV